MNLEKAICLLAQNAAKGAGVSMNGGHIDALKTLFEIPENQMTALRAAYVTAYIQSKRSRTDNVITITDFKRKFPTETKRIIYEAD
jgi:hypothetical protein